MAAPRVTRTLAYLWVGLLAVLVAGPALMPGFALSYDLVFTPLFDNNSAIREAVTDGHPALGVGVFLAG